MCRIKWPPSIGTTGRIPSGRVAGLIRIGIVEEEYLPENLKEKIYYQPSDQGFERKIKKRLEHWRKKKGEKAPPQSLSPL